MSSYVGIGTVTDTASGTPTIALPAAIQANDTLVCCAMLKSNAQTVNAPSSALTWTERVAYSTYHKMWTALHDGAAAAPTIATGGNAICAFIMAFRGVNVSAPYHNGNSSLFTSDSGGTNNAIRVPSLTVTQDNCVIVHFGRFSWTMTSVVDMGGSWVEVLDRSLSSNTFATQAQYLIETTAADVTQTNEAVTGGGAFAITTTGCILALAPAAAGGIAPAAQSLMNRRRWA